MCGNGGEQGLWRYYCCLCSSSCCCYIIQYMSGSSSSVIVGRKVSKRQNAKKVHESVKGFKSIDETIALASAAAACNTETLQHRQLNGRRQGRKIVALLQWD
jgi:hypothetical protein